MDGVPTRPLEANALRAVPGPAGSPRGGGTFCTSISPSDGSEEEEAGKGRVKAPRRDPGRTPSPSRSPPPPATRSRSRDRCSVQHKAGLHRYSRRRFQHTGLPQLGPDARELGASRRHRCRAHAHTLGRLSGHAHQMHGVAGDVRHHHTEIGSHRGGPCPQGHAGGGAQRLATEGVQDACGRRSRCAETCSSARGRISPCTPACGRR